MREKGRERDNEGEGKERGMREKGIMKERGRREE